MPTIKDVAAEAGVTSTTVSRVLNNRGYISEETREKVYSAMEKLNYMPNEMARNLSRQKSDYIGVILPSVEHPYFSKVLHWLEHYVTKHNYKIMVCISENSREKELQYIDLLYSHRVLGIVVCSHIGETMEHLDSNCIGVFNSVAATMGGGILAYGAIMGASIIGGLFETVLGFFLKPLRKFFPSVVTGTVVMSIGLSLISVGINSFGGGNKAEDFGSIENLLLALFVLIVILFFKHATKGFLSSSSILFGIIFGYIAAMIMGFVLPKTGVTADGVEYTKAWVLNWDKVAEASWFAVPKLLPVKPVFDLRAILPVLIMFIVTAVETVGDISGVMEGGLDREATDKELAGGVMCDGLGSSFAAIFGVLPNTSFSQNVGLVAMTKVVNRFALATGAIFLVLCGLCPKLAALVSIMPQSVLGGAAVMMFSSIVISGIQLITKNPLNARNLSIVSVALGVGYGMGANPGILVHTPEVVQLVFGGSGIVPAAMVAILLNIILPKEEK